MASIKLQVYRGKDSGISSCDFRGDKFIGHDQGDEHRTIFEIDPASDELVTLALMDGPKLNALMDAFKAAEPEFAGEAASLLGLAGEGDPGLRIGVFDN